MTSKVLTGIQKRVLKLNAAIQNLDPFKSATLVSKILSCFCDTSFREIVQTQIGLKKFSALHPRMIKKCQNLKTDIEKEGDQLTEHHHNGMLNGYGEEFFGRICYGVWLSAALVIAYLKCLYFQFVRLQGKMKDTIKRARSKSEPKIMLKRIIPILQLHLP